MFNTPHDSIALFQAQKLNLDKGNYQKFILFFAFFQLLGQALGNSNLISLKPIPIIFMILTSIYSLETDRSITRGLICGLIGDLCLMFPTTLLFEAGAVSFIVGHICYIRAFTKNYHIPGSFKEFRSLMPHIGALLIFSILLINSFLLWKYLPNMGLFVLYGIFLSSMSASSFYRTQQKDHFQYWIGVMGTVIFLISDYLIAYSKFMGYENSMNGLMIMTLYYGGQYMILKGNSQEKVSK